MVIVAKREHGAGRGGKFHATVRGAKKVRRALVVSAYRRQLRQDGHAENVDGGHVDVPRLTIEWDPAVVLKKNTEFLFRWLVAEHHLVIHHDVR